MTASMIERGRAKVESRGGLYDFVLGARSSGDGGGRLSTSFFVETGYWGRPGAQDRWIAGTPFEFWQRLHVHHGLNLYCAACRQIALAATGREDALREAERHTRLLLDDRAGESGPLRGWSDGAGDWRYGDRGRTLTRSEGSSFFFGAICDRYRLTDPHTGASHFPEEMGGGPLFWNAYDPFLGENSWAALLGPLQVAFLRARGGTVDPACDEVRLALSLVPACLAMQSPAGGVYARPAAAGRAQERLISNETNLTLYAGLTMLRRMVGGDPRLRARMAGVDRLRQGLMRYFRRHLLGAVDGEPRFHACGTFVDGVFRPGIMANGAPARFAADVHTWGMSILGVEEIDGRHGRGTCFRLWEAVKRHAGFHADGDPAGAPDGIGFSSGPQRLL